MGEMGKEQIFLEVAANLTRFYTFMAHSLRFMMEDAASDQITLEQVRAQLDQAWTTLLPRLERNPVMKGKLEKDYNTTLKLTRDYRNLSRDDPGHESMKQEARRLHSYAREKSASLSDLVAIFRSL